MARTLRIASQAHAPITLTGPKPADETVDPPRVVIWPCRPGDPPMVTEGVDADLFYDWIAAHPHEPAVIHRWFEVLPEPVEEAPTETAAAPGLTPETPALPPPEKGGASRKT